MNISYPRPIETVLLLILCTFNWIGCGKTGQKLPEGFEIHPDFNLELVVSEPVIFDPVEMQFDENGHAFVLEMPGYPMRDEDSKIIMVSDTNNDGIYDHRHLFADGLGVASSFLPYKGGFLVASPPHLIWLIDDDNDHTADRKEILMSGFSEGNLQHNFNGLTYGLDNWIYAANGGNSGKPYFAGDSINQLDLRGDDFRFNLEEKKIERVGESSGGFKLAFDHWGHIYETHNLEHVSHLVFEEKYARDFAMSPPHALTNISDHEENGLSRIYPIGEQETRVNHPEQSGYFSGACGITFYGGGKFPEGFNDHLFVADCVLNLVHLDVLAPEGASFKTSRMRKNADFIASTDRAFRPVNMTTGPDGAFYLIDMYRTVIEHPEWIPDEMEANMDLNAGKEKGRIYKITPTGQWTGKTVKLDRSDLPGLANALDNPNQWVRVNAQRLLMETGDQKNLSLLESNYNHVSSYGRLHILWTLDGLGLLSTQLLINGLTDAAAGVRENAVKIAEQRINLEPKLLTSLLNLTEDPDPRVRMSVALALGTIDETLYINNVSRISENLVKMAQSDLCDQWTAMAIATAARKNAIPFCGQLIKNISGAPSEIELYVLAALGRDLGKKHNEMSILTLIDLVDENLSAVEGKSAIINAIADGWQSGGKKVISKEVTARLLTSLESIEKNAQVTLITATGSLRKEMGLPVSGALGNLITQAKASVFQEDISTAERLHLLQLIGLEQFKDRKGTLLALLDNRQPVQLQNEALLQLRQSDDRSVGPELLKLWPLLGPEARKNAGNILLYKSYNHDLLLTAIENGKIGLGELNLDLERRRVLLFWADQQIKSRAEALFSDSGVVTRKEAITNMRPALSLTGNTDKGLIVYQTLCAECHKYGEVGKDVGPVLTEINRKSKESLLYDILDPNAAVDTRYLNYQVSTTDGDIYTGMIYQETDNEIRLRMMGGLEKTVNKNEISSFTSLGTSLMLEGLEENMAPQDMADLLAFLQQSN